MNARICAITLALAILTPGLASCAPADGAPRLETGTAPTEPSPSALERAQDLERSAQSAADTVWRMSYIEGDRGFFQPEKLCTRAEAAKILGDLGLSAPGGAGFPDVDQDAWYAEAVAQVSSALTGYADGNFHPAEPIRAAELLTVLCRLQNVELPEPGVGAAWYAPAVAAAEERGWLDGLRTFDPLEPVDRAAAVSICGRAVGRVPDEDAIGALDCRVFLDVTEDSDCYADIIDAALDHSEDWSQVAWPALAAGLHVLDGSAYYVRDDGSVEETPGLLEVEGARYLVSEDHGRIYADGAVHLLDGSPVFCTEEGPLLTNAEWHGFRFDEMGRYTSGDAELDRMVEEIISAQTDERMTQAQKLYACHCYVRDSYTYLGRNAPLPNTIQTMPWEDAVAFAKKMYETGKGDCYNFCAAFYFLAKRLGYDATAVVGHCVYVHWGTAAYPHGWVEIPFDGEIYIFDAEIENNNRRIGVSNEVYGVYRVRYADAPAYYIKN